MEKCRAICLTNHKLLMARSLSFSIGISSTSCNRLNIRPVFSPRKSNSRQKPQSSSPRRVFQLSAPLRCVSTVRQLINGMELTGVSRSQGPSSRFVKLCKLMKLQRHQSTFHRSSILAYRTLSRFGYATMPIVSPVPT